MKLKEETIGKLKWVLTVLLTVLAVYLCFRYILPLLIPFIIAYFLAWIIRPSTEFMHRRLKMNRLFGGTISLIVVVALAGTGLYFLLKVLFRQAVAFIKNIPIYIDTVASRLDSICHYCDEIFGLTDGTARIFVDDNITVMVERIRTNTMPSITGQTLSIVVRFIAALGILLIILISAVLIVKDLPGAREHFQTYDFYEDVHKVMDKLSDAGMAYLRCQVIVILIIAVISTLGLTIMGSNYALLIGIGIAAADALPIIGSGLIYIPWSIIMLINGDIYSAAILVTTFLVCQVVREILEPRLIGNRIGIKPLYTLMSMYIGVKLFSIVGFILGPIGLVIIMTIIKVINDKNGVSLQNQKSNT